MKVSKEDRTRLHIAGRVIQDRGQESQVSTEPDPLLAKIASAMEAMAKQSHPAQAPNLLPILESIADTQARQLELIERQPAKRKFEFKIERDNKGFIANILAVEV